MTRITKSFVCQRRVQIWRDGIFGGLGLHPLYSLIETCKANAVDPYRYLVALFKALPSAKTADDYERLLPWQLALGD